MELSFTPKQLAFRDEVRAFLKNDMPPAMRAKADIDAHFDMDEVMEWHKILYKKGWVAPHWPKAAGGPGLDVAERFILTEELERAGTPQLSPFGLVMVGPLIMQFATDAQKQRFLPKILSGEEVWCQGYSEPNAGSDLASLRTTAADDGQGNFVVNGQKTWTTYAQHADWIFCLVRTDPKAKKQEGISFLLIDLKTPGITVKPFLTTGGTPAFCETWFENVVVPKENLVVLLNGGWTVAKALLGHERTMIAAVGLSSRAIRRAKRIAAATMKDGKPLLDDPGFRAKIARLEIKLRALQMANYRTLASAQHGKAPGPESSILKLRGSEIQQQAAELAMEVMGEDSLTWFNEEGVVPPIEEWVPSQFNYLRATTIYGGSNEIQRNIIAKLILGWANTMNFELSDDQKMLLETVASFVKKESPVTRMRHLRDDPKGFSPEVWRRMGEYGWLGVSFPESVGGMGGTFVDASLVLGELGTTLVPEPYVSLLVAGKVIEKLGSAEQHKKWLVPAIEGKSVLALALDEKDNRFAVGAIGTKATKAGAGYKLDGEKRWVLDGAAADVFVVAAKTGAGVSAFVVPKDAKGLEVKPVKTMDGRRAAMLSLKGVEVGADALLGAEGAAGPVFELAQDSGAAAACAEGVGILKTVLMMTVEYLRTREQFGVKIGAFQALQHRAVDMFVEAELCRSTGILAAIRVDEADETTRKSDISAAKVQLATGGKFVTQQSIQLHGGIGVTDEHDVGLYFKRMHVLNTLWGDEEHHLRRFATLPSFTADL